MVSPYTDHPLEAVLAAEAGLASVSTVVFFGIAEKDRLRAWLLVLVVWAAALLPFLPAFVSSLQLAPATVSSAALYRAAFVPLEAMLVVVALRAKGVRIAMSLLAIGGATWLSRWMVGSDWEGAALHIAAAWVVWAIAHAPRSVAKPAPTSPTLMQLDRRDLFAFVLGTVVAAVVSHYVLGRGVDGSDEWAYTYQAAVFAKGRLYGDLPACHQSFRSFWVFWRENRMFAQYQPGWPLFLVPFVWAKTIWLGGPVSLGLLAMLGGRLGRLASFLHAGREDVARRAGTFAAVSLVFTNTLLINGASRFPHVFVAALFCAAVERGYALAVAPDPRTARVVAAQLGFAAGWLLCTRAPDVGLTFGVLVVLSVALVRRKLGVVPTLVAGGVSVAWMVLLLAISKAQTGKWGELPYAMTAEFYPWNAYHYSVPPPSLLKWHLPLATGAYSFFPLAPSVGLAGCVLGLRSQARKVVGMCGLGSLLMLVFYGAMENGRGWDFGYGPRYQLHTVVPMAVGAALVWTHAGFFRARTATFGRVAAALSFAGVVAVTVWTFPHNYAVVADSMRIDTAVRAAKLGRAIVIVPNGMGRYGELDVPRNYPIDLYDSEVLVASTRDAQCVMTSYPDRAIYRAENGSPIRFVKVR